MTGDPSSDRAAGAALVGAALLLLALLPGAPAVQPGAPGSVPPPASPPSVAVDPPTTLLAAEGLVLEEQRWRYGEASGRAWRVRVPLPGRAQVVPSEAVVPFAALVPTDPGPWAAINGGFYERGPMGLVVSGGVERSPRSPRGGSGIFSWSAAGPSIGHRDAWAPGAPEALQSIDRLVDAGRSLVKRREEARAAARSAVAISDEALWLVALADEASVAPLPQGGVQLHDTVVLGLPLWAFADYLAQELGARTALNLDGAVSTQLQVSTPDGTWEVRGERGTINALVVRPAPASP